MTGSYLLLLVAHTVRFEDEGIEVVRIISAREPLHNSGEAVAVGSGDGLQGVFLRPITGLLARKTTQQTTLARLTIDRKEFYAEAP